MTPLTLTMGEPAGIGAEIAFGAYGRLRATGPAFFLIDDPTRLGAFGESVVIEHPREAEAAFARGLPVLAQPLARRVSPGRPEPGNADAVIASIRRAVEFVTAGAAAAVVTNPIEKSVLYKGGFPHPGHTEYLAALAGTGVAPAMMLAAADLRVVPVTVHLPLAAVPAALTAAAIVHAGILTADALRRDFGVAAPRIAVAALNPHAGESDASLGTEERAIIAPAVHELRARGIDARGPAPADTLFHEGARRSHDAVLCMYHDQALIPLKTIDFWGGVNVTLGLPFVRTSPDHGTALDIAGTGRANPASLVAAIELAAAMATRRRG